MKYDVIWSNLQAREHGLDAPLGVGITFLKPRRTRNQNDLLWPLCRALGAEVGLTAEEMYEEAACEIFGYELMKFRGHARKRPLKRPSKADRDEYSQIIDLLYQWAAEQGVEV